MLTFRSGPLTVILPVTVGTLSIRKMPQINKINPSNAPSYVSDLLRNYSFHLFIQGNTMERLKCTREDTVELLEDFDSILKSRLL